MDYDWLNKKARSDKTFREVGFLWFGIGIVLGFGLGLMAAYWTLTGKPWA